VLPAEIEMRMGFYGRNRRMTGNKMNSGKLINLILHFIKIGLIDNLAADSQRSFKRQLGIEHSARISDRFFGSASYA